MTETTQNYVTFANHPVEMGFDPDFDSKFFDIKPKTGPYHFRMLLDSRGEIACHLRSDSTHELWTDWTPSEVDLSILKSYHRVLS